MCDETLHFETITGVHHVAASKVDMVVSTYPNERAPDLLSFTLTEIGNVAHSTVYVSFVEADHTHAET